MKTRVCFFIAALLNLSLTIYSQSIDHIRVTAEFQDQPIDQILEEIAGEHQLQLFITNRALIDQKKSASFSNTSLQQALGELLEGTVADYLVYRDYAVVIGPRSKIRQSYSAAFYSRFEEIVTELPSADAVVIGNRELLQPFSTVTITGKVIDNLTGEEIIGASVIMADSSDMTVTNSSGQFSIRATSGKQELIVQYVGYDRTYLDLMVFSEDFVEIEIAKNVLNLEEVTIEAVAEDANVASTQVGVARVDMKGIDKIPVFMGEVDIEKVLLLQPGVSKVAEGFDRLRHLEH